MICGGKLNNFENANISSSVACSLRKKLPTVV